ncbi:hypothetical protein BV898_17962 [Hypsibius exemplaris]|uniref:Secreted protein n=1 Tax=Hypsibius exemplaris TaxID=2072580 RepID=A0A9X6NGI2_HYPEX|nr:hypothetical protein BV898_17962 [Hypsibius exemplaris]
MAEVSPLLALILLGRLQAGPGLIAQAGALLHRGFQFGCRLLHGEPVGELVELLADDALCGSVSANDVTRSTRSSPLSRSRANFRAYDENCGINIFFVSGF